MSTVHKFPQKPGQTNIGARLNAVIAAQRKLREFREVEDVYERIRVDLMRDDLAAFVVQLVADVKKMEDRLHAFEDATGYKIL